MNCWPSLVVFLAVMALILAFHAEAAEAKREFFENVSMLWIFIYNINVFS